MNRLVFEFFFSSLAMSDRPFYSCLLSDLAFDWQRSDLTLIQTSLLLSCECTWLALE